MKRIMLMMIMIMIMMMTMNADNDDDTVATTTRKRTTTFQLFFVVCRICSSTMFRDHLLPPLSLVSLPPPPTSGLR